VNEAYVEKNRGGFRRCFGLGKYNKRDIGQKRLRNIWDNQGVPFISPFAVYINSEKLKQYWRTYETNEQGQRHVFRSMDRIKITFHLLMTSFNIYKLSQLKFDFIDSFGPLHDIYELEKRPKLPLFQNFPDVGQNVAKNQASRSYVSFMQNFADEAEDRDFMTEDLSDTVGGTLFSPEEVNMDPIQNYFGEKIGLYFVFLQDFTIKIKWLAIFSILVIILDFILLRMGEK
jgi:hypothetical protein